MEEPILPTEKVILSVAKKPPLFQRENSDPQFENMLRTGRFNSADIAKDTEKRRKKQSKKSHRSSSSKKSSRSKSVGDNAHFMRTLTVEKTDVLSTPLSSLRSCSEYNRGNTAQGFIIPKAVENEVKRGFWSTFIIWSSDFDKKNNKTNSSLVSSVAPKKKTQHRVRFRSRDSEEHSFFLERLRFNEANLRDGEDYDYHRHRNSSSNSNSSDSSWLLEESSPYEYSYFRRKKSQGKWPMEIELTTYKIEYFDVYTEPPTTVSATARFPSFNNIPHSSVMINPNSERSRSSSRMRLSLNLPTSNDNSVDANNDDFFEENIYYTQNDDDDTSGNTSNLGLRLSEHSSPYVRHEPPALLSAVSPLVITSSSSTNVNNTTGLRRVTSFRTLERISSGTHTTTSSSPRVPATPTTPNSRRDTAQLLQQQSPRHTFIERILQTMEQRWRWVMSQCRVWYNEHSFPGTPPTQDTATTSPAAAANVLYEVLRLQPFSCGGYLRGMLLAGLSSTVFQLYSLLTWPDWQTQQQQRQQSFWQSLASPELNMQSFLYLALCVQLLCNLVQLPLRVKLHFFCWEAARAPDMEQGNALLREMLTSDAWVINRVLGHVVDAFALLTLLVAEVYLYSSRYWLVSETAAEDVSELLLLQQQQQQAKAVSDVSAFRTLLISLCATSLLTFVSRVVVAVAYSWSLHDPSVMQEARRRGLTKFDLENLPTYVFACKDDASTEECAICLGEFELGEMLIALPCNSNLHSNLQTTRSSPTATAISTANVAQHLSPNTNANGKNHSFHAHCIRTWLTRQNSCPLCQRVV